MGLLRNRQPQRVELLDELRGFCILLMVAYHAAYDLVFLFGMDIPAFHSPLLRLAQPFVAGIFILISGIACRYSRSNLRRGAIALGLGLALTLGTALIMPEQIILFGILHLLGASMILFGLLRPVLDKLAPLPGLVLCVAAFVLLWGVPAGTVGLKGLWSVTLPNSLYTTSFMFPLGLVGPSFASSDYFPLVPWLFLFLAGTYLGRYFVAGSMPSGFYRPHFRPLAVVGRKAIWIYILHQPVVYGVLWALFWVGGRLGLLP